MGVLINLPQDMVVEWKIRRDLPLLAPFQFEAIRWVIESRQRSRPEGPLITRLVPVRLRQLLSTLDCACALAADNLFDGAEFYGAQFAGKDGLELGKLFEP